MSLSSWTSLCCTIALVSVLPYALHAAPPRLMFEKQIPLKQEKNAFRYTIQEGEYVYSILRSMDVPENKLYNMAKEVEKLNPHLENLNQVEPGTTLLLPQDLRPEAEAPAPDPPEPEDVARVAKEAAVDTLSATIAPGDSLVKLLREKANLPDRLIFDEYLKLFQELNPQVADINALEVGQEVVLPIPPGQAAELDSRTNATLEVQAPPRERPQQPQQAEASPREVNKQATLAILKQMGFRFAPGQELLYPYSSQEWLRINLEQMPLANTPWGTAIVFVPEPVMSRIQEEEMRAADLNVCRVNASWDPAVTFQRLENLSQRNIIFWGQGSPLIMNISRQVLELTADIVLIDNSSFDQITHLFRMDQSQLQALPPLVRGYLDNQSIHVHTLVQASAARFTSESFPDPADIYVPAIPASNAWPDIQTLLQAESMNLSLPDPGFPSVLRALKEEGLASETVQRFSFVQSPSLKITLSLPVIRLLTGDEETFLIEPGLADPYLVSQLNLMGYSCYAVTP